MEALSSNVSTAGEVESPKAFLHMVMGVVSSPSPMGREGIAHLTSSRLLLQIRHGVLPIKGCRRGLISTSSAPFKHFGASVRPQLLFQPLALVANFKATEKVPPAILLL
jgi:hypothetical protein